MSVLGDLITAFIVTKEELNQRTRDDARANAALNKAFMATYDYLKLKNGAYSPNEELRELWNDAAESVTIVNAELGDTLFRKARFWLDPEYHLDKNLTDEIPELNRILDEMEKISMQIKRRKFRR